MSCEVFIYDDVLSPVSSSLIQIVENDSRGVKIDVQANAARGAGLYGATMKQPNPAVPVGIWVDDTGGTYAPTGLEFLNPSASPRLDVTLFPLPAPVGAGGGGGTGGGGHGGQGGPGGPDPGDLADLTVRQGGEWRFSPSDETMRDQVPRPMNDAVTLAVERGWSEGEMMGVSTLIATIATARALVDPDAEFVGRMRRWERQLDALGIGDVGRSSHGGGGVPRDYAKFRFPELDLRRGSSRFILPEREIGEADA